MTDYANGFKDGFAAGLEEGKKIVEEQWLQEKIKEIEKSIPEPCRWPSTQPLTFSADKCPKCGITISGVMGYVCQSINCPTYYKTWTGPTQYNDWSAGAGAQGAVGSMSTNYESSSSAPGTNGPSGPIDYYKR